MPRIYGWRRQREPKTISSPNLPPPKPRRTSGAFFWALTPRPPLPVPRAHPPRERGRWKLHGFQLLVGRGRPSPRAAKPLRETRRPLREARKPLRETRKPLRETRKPLRETRKP